MTRGMNNNRVFIFVDVQAHLNPTSTRGGVDSQTKTNRPIGGQSIPIIDTLNFWNQTMNVYPIGLR